MTRSEREDRGKREREKRREEEEKKSLDKFTILNCKAQASTLACRQSALTANVMYRSFIFSSIQRDGASKDESIIWETSDTRRNV